MNNGFGGGAPMDGVGKGSWFEGGYGKLDWYSDGRGDEK